MSTSCSQNADQLRSADYAALLEGAVVSIFSTVADIELLSQPTDPATETSHNSITVILNFGGHEQGFLALNCSDALAGLLAINMSGDTEELSDSYLCGALSETAHIIVTSLFENMRRNKFLWDHFKKIEVPCLFLKAEKSKLITNGMVMMMKGFRPKMEVSIIKGVGHHELSFHAAKEVAAEIGNFFKKN